MSLVNEDEEVVVDMFVKPRSKVIDYQTKYSGITAQLLEGCNNDLGTATKTIRQFVKAKDVLVGHDILNDLKEKGLTLFSGFKIELSVYNLKIGAQAQSQQLHR